MKRSMSRKALGKASRKALGKASRKALGKASRKALGKASRKASRKALGKALGKASRKALGKASRKASRKALGKASRRKQRNQRKQQRGGNGSLAEAFPVTTWGSWSSLPGSTLWGPGQQAPAPLANGGLYTDAQSTGTWASQPMPATQYAFAAEAAKVAGNPEVFYQQRPVTQPGTTWSPWVGETISSENWSARLPKGVSSH